ncbi:glycosyltransferase family 2 protein [Gemmatimonadota bacterium]
MFPEPHPAMKQSIGASASIPLASACIPAFNEERNIPRVLEFLTQQPHSLLDDIVVCMNGCTDNTGEVVSGFSDRDSRVRLIESQLGKPNAWNALVKEARNDSLLFLDADIQIKDEQCLDHLLARLHGSDSLIAVSGIPLPLSEPGRPRSVVEILLYPPFRHGLVGSVYAFKRPRLLERMRSLGYERMPRDLIREDLWLVTLLKKDEVSVENRSVVYISVGELDSYLRYVARLDVGLLQVREEYPEQFRQWLGEFRYSGRKIEAFLRRLKEVEGVLKKAKVLGQAAFVEVVKCLYRSRRKRLFDEICAQYRAEGGGVVLADKGRITQSKV